MLRNAATIFAALGLLASNALLSANPARAADADFIILASTTSTQNSGLFDHLLPRFEAASGIEVRVVALGTGAALAYGARCDADLVLVHAPGAERDFIKQGYGVERVRLMHNDFVIVGPAGDPAEIRGVESAARALADIRAHGADFVSRGDRSGTHIKELALWRENGLEATRDFGTWYRESGAGMGQSLNMARAMDAYILVDRGTWLSFENQGDLEILVEGDPVLFNPYSLIAINPGNCPETRSAAAQSFIDWLISGTGQRAIAEFRLAGQPLFIPDRLQR